MKSINDACKAIGILTNRVISYHEMVKILYSMRYIWENITEYEKLLIDNIFQSISNPDKATLFIKNLFSFIWAMHNITSKEKFKFNNYVDEGSASNYTSVVDIPEDPMINIRYDREITESRMHPYGYVSEKGNFHFNSYDEVKEVIKLYKVFIDNSKLTAPWAYFNATSPDYEKEKAEIYCFKPKINKSKSKKGFTEDDEYKNLSHAQVLLQKGEKYKQKVDGLRAQKYHDELNGWTFTPLTNYNKNEKVKSRLFERGRSKKLWIR